MDDRLDDRLVDALVERARQGVGLLSPKQLDAGWERLQLPDGGPRFPQTRRAPLRTWALGFGTACALACVAWVGYHVVPPKPTLALGYTLDGVAQSTGSAISGTADRPTALRFSDDSQVVLTPSTKVSVAATDARGAHVVLVDGDIDVEVKHRANTSWEFAAGPFRVKVRGTAFRLSFAAQRGYLSLRMTSGLVEVFAPSNRTIAVGAGESLELFAEPPASQAAQPRPASAAPAASERAADEPLTVPALAPPATRGESSRVVARKSPARSGERLEPGLGPAPVQWSDWVSRGKFAAVVADAEQRGLAVVIARASAAELSSLADAARYTRRADVARQVLLTIRARFAGSDHARDASFFLGRLAESTSREPEAALGWYDTYLGENPRGLYASEALGREMTLLAGGAPERARSIARTYLARFPRGPQADLARSLLESTPD